MQVKEAESKLPGGQGRGSCRAGLAPQSGGGRAEGWCDWGS